MLKLWEPYRVDSPHASHFHRSTMSDFVQLQSNLLITASFSQLWRQLDLLLMTAEAFVAPEICFQASNFTLVLVSVTL